MNNAPFLTPNPQDFNLRIVWSADGSTKMVAELSSCKWLPRIGETLVLPIDETCKPNWRKFKVFDIVYDFQHQTVRVFCSPVNWTPPSAKTLIKKIEEPSDRWEVWEKAFVASEATTKALDLERESYLLSEIDREKDVDDFLQSLKDQLRDL